MNQTWMWDEAYEQELIRFAQAGVRTRSYSDEEGAYAQLIREKMEELGFDQAYIDPAGNVVGRVGNGPKIIHFDSHMDTVQVNDGDEWVSPPFGGEIVDGMLYGRGSVDMKSSLSASVFAAALAKRAGLLEGKTVYVTGSVCEEYCDGVCLEHFYRDAGIRPDFCVICEPSDNTITLGHTGKVQARIKTRGVSAHGSAPEKGVNAVYEMAEIITRVEELNRRLSQTPGGGTIVLSQISSVAASLNAVPSQCEIYLDRRLRMGETTAQVREELDQLDGEGAGIPPRPRPLVHPHGSSPHPGLCGGLYPGVRPGAGEVRPLGFRDQRGGARVHGHPHHRLWSGGVQAGPYAQ